MCVRVRPPERVLCVHPTGKPCGARALTHAAAIYYNIYMGVCVCVCVCVLITSPRVDIMCA